MLTDTAKAIDALHSIPPDLPRDEWVKVGMGAHAAGVDFDTFDAWSAGAGNYDAAASRDVWKSIKPGKGIGPGTLYRVGAEHGWRMGDLGYVDEDGYIYLTGRRKNLIITKNGENVSPEELENALSVNHLIKEIIVRESEGVIEAEIFPDSEYAQNTGIADIRPALQALIDEYNVNAPAYKRIYSLKVRESEFEKTASRKIKRS